MLQRQDNYILMVIWIVVWNILALVSTKYQWGIRGAGNKINWILKDLILKMLYHKSSPRCFSVGIQFQSFCHCVKIYQDPYIISIVILCFCLYKNKIKNLKNNRRSVMEVYFQYGYPHKQ